MARGSARSRDGGWNPRFEQPVTATDAAQMMQQALTSQPAAPVGDPLRLRLERYAPRKVSPQVYARIRPDVVDLALSTAALHCWSEKRICEVMPAIAALATWWVGTLGQPFDPMRMLASHQIDAWAQSQPTGPTMTVQEARSRQTNRTQLRRVAEAAGAPGSQPIVTLGRGERLAPYTALEKARFYVVAARLPDPWRTDVHCLFDAGFGGGLGPSAVEHLQAHWIIPIPDGCTVVVPPQAGRGGNRPSRAVHVLGPAGHRLVRLAAERPTGYMFRPAQGRGGKALDGVIRKLDDQRDIPHYNTFRAASTWAVDLLNAGITFRVIAEMAGWAPGTKTPTELIPHLNPATAKQCLDALRKANP